MRTSGMTMQAKHHFNGPGERALGFGLLGGPLAWLLQLAVSYPLVPLVCVVGWDMVFHLVTLVTALLALAAGTVAWQSWQWVREEPHDGVTRDARKRFMALSGVLFSVLFFVIILAQWLPVFFLSSCDRGP